MDPAAAIEDAFAGVGQVGIGPERAAKLAGAEEEHDGDEEAEESAAGPARRRAEGWGEGGR